MNQEIKISKKELLDRYSVLDIFFKDFIVNLYEVNNSIDVSRIALQDKENDYNLIEDSRGCVGIYIFFDKKGNPKYIGKGGSSLSLTGKDLHFRIRQEVGFGNAHNTLYNNIRSIESILQNRELSEADSLLILRNLHLRFFSIGTRIINKNEINEKMIRRTEGLETLLIALFNPTYNK